MYVLTLVLASLMTNVWLYQLGADPNEAFVSATLAAIIALPIMSALSLLEENGPRP